MEQLQPNLTQLQVWIIIGVSVIVIPYRIALMLHDTPTDTFLLYLEEKYDFFSFLALLSAKNKNLQMSLASTYYLAYWKEHEESL